MSRADSRAAQLYSQAIVWDMIWPCHPSDPPEGNTWDKLSHFEAAGHTVLGLTIAGDNHNASEALKAVAAARRFILSQPERFVLIESVEDVLRAKATRKLGLELHFEGTNCLERDLSLIDAFYALGVRHNLLAFNLANSACGGCADEDDRGLTRFGANVIREMERVGMLLDLSHVGYRSSMQAMEMATKPVVFSHSNVRAVRDSFRNVSDDQIVACARLNGLVGISGSSEYLGDPLCRPDKMLEHIKHVTQLVGSAHVGIGFDVCFDAAGLTRWARARPDEWPMTRDPQWPGFTYALPEHLLDLTELLLASGFSESEVRGILGENYLRICKEVWTSPTRSPA